MRCRPAGTGTASCFDDIVDEKVARSVTEMRKAEESLKLAYSLGTQDGCMRMIGTRYRSTTRTGI